MSLEALAGASAKWLWEQYGKAIADIAKDALHEQWTEFHWKDAEARYRQRVYDLHNTTRLLGHPNPITIDDVFTDVYVLDKLTAFRRYDFSRLQDLPLDPEILSINAERKPALRLALTKERLFLLGKPGSGKTTFLKYLTLKACTGQIPKTPIFISLKEWADKVDWSPDRQAGYSQDLLDFLVQQFEVCSFPDAKQFIQYILAKGNALVLFDGLDEVNQEAEQQARIIATLMNFAKQYPESQICITCRIAATDYSFEHFTYLEIADFDEGQMRLFARKWYQDDPKRLTLFMSEFEKPEHEGLRELARTPLLLALLCLTFDENLSFPLRRVDLYKEAIDALLKKWDSSRGIRRDMIYRTLSSGRKEQLLARIAAENFEAGSYFIRQETLEGQIRKYLLTLRGPSDDEEPDSESILKAIEAQHGILVERARGIYSFSHLTVQEYFTARYVVDNAANGAATRLIQNHLTQTNWREVFLLTASLIDNADIFFNTFLRCTVKLIPKYRDKKCLEVLNWMRDNTQDESSSSPAFRAKLLFLAFYRERFHTAHHTRLTNLDRAFYLAGDLAIILNRNLANIIERYGFNYSIPSQFLTDRHGLERAVSLEREYGLEIERDTRASLNKDNFAVAFLAQELGIKLNRLRPWQLSKSEIACMFNYMYANELLLECLNLASVTDRRRIEEQLLLPPENLNY